VFGQCGRTYFQMVNNYIIANFLFSVYCGEIRLQFFYVL
jgi:hypothetical protein